MTLSAFSAWVFLPFVAPLCLYVVYTDLSQMRITNVTVVTLAMVFFVVGLFVLPFDDYAWRLLHLPVILLIGFVLNAAGVMGAGDAKFLAAAAPFLSLSDWPTITLIFTTILIAAVCAHRLAKVTKLRSLVPHWTSWDQGKKFPMGFALGPSLVVYLLLCALYGA